MRIPKLSHELRRLRSQSPYPFSFLAAHSIHSQNPKTPNLMSSPTDVWNSYSKFGDRLQFRSSASWISFSYSNSFRSFSVHSLTGNSENESFKNDGDSATESEHFDPGFGGSELAEEVVIEDGLFLPVRVLISLLDGYHDLTGLPWWAIIASSTLALRIALLPVLVLQLKKLKRISELLPKLPPPFPPPFSGRSYIKQYLHFQKEKRAVGCPSYLWFLASISVQAPCFLLWMTCIRRMCLDHHPGFDCGGILWFQNLTELPHGVLGTVLPVMIAGMHFINVQISFQMSRVGEASGLLSLLAKYYKLYLEILTLPILVIGLHVPQGSLVYWLTNSSLTVIQQVTLRNPAVRGILGLPVKATPEESGNPTEPGTLEMKPLDTPVERKISLHNLPPNELLAHSIQFLAKGQRDRAIPLLRMALEKDPEYVRALIVMGQTLLQKGLLVEATEYLERSISNLLLPGHPTTAEEVDLLIIASSWAGVTYIRQGKTADGLEHLQRIALFEEPEDPKSKAHYYDGLLLLASALYNEGRKPEALNYLRMAAAYDPVAYKDYLEQCEKDEDDFASDLVSSRRDY